MRNFWLSRCRTGAVPSTGTEQISAEVRAAFQVGKRFVTGRPRNQRVSALYAARLHLFGGLGLLFHCELPTRGHAWVDSKYRPPLRRLISVRSVVRLYVARARAALMLNKQALYTSLV